MDKSQTVWFVTNIHSSSKGGVARSVNTLGSYLQQKKHKVFFVFAPKKNTNFLLFSIYAFFKFLKSLFVNKPTWIIARSTDAFFILLFIKLLRIKTKVIIYSHGWEPLIANIEKRMPKQIIDNPTTFKAKLIRFPMLKISSILSDFIISGTIFETRYLKKRYKKYSSKFKYLPNALILKNLSDDISKKENIFLTVANSNWKKNLSYTIKLFHFLRKKKSEFKLICAGTSLSDKEFTSKFGSLENIKNIPSVKPNEMAKLYKESSYLISSSRYEGGHSFAILEGMIYQNIVFASNIPSTLEIITSGKNGVIISGNNIEGDAEIITKTISSEQDQIVKKASKSIKKFSIDKIGPQLERLLNI